MKSIYLINSPRQSKSRQVLLFMNYLYKKYTRKNCVFDTDFRYQDKNSIWKMIFLTNSNLYLNDYIIMCFSQLLKITDSNTKEKKENTKTLNENKTEWLIFPKLLNSIFTDTCLLFKHITIVSSRITSIC